MMSGIARSAKPESVRGHAAAPRVSAALASCAEPIAHDAQAAAALAALAAPEEFFLALAAFAETRGVALDAGDRALVTAGRAIDHGCRLRSWPRAARRGWQPIAIEFGAEGAELVWACGAAGEDDAFHEVTVMRLRTRPLNRLFAVRTPLSEAFAADLEAEALPLRAAIFHMSRCGSTLIAQALKAWPRVRVVSEPGVLDTAITLAASGYDPDWKIFRAVLAALSQPCAGDESVVVKADAWHAIALAPLLQRLRAPWLFVYRDPLEVLASHAREPGRHTVPGMLPEAWLDALPADAKPSLPIEHAARVIGTICAAVVPHARADALIDYSELPQALLARVAPHFGLDPARADRAYLDRTLARHAKRPLEPFVDDRAAKRAAVDDVQRAAAARWIAPHHARLEALRSAGHMR